MPSHSNIRIEVSADTSQAQEALLACHRNVIRLSYESPDLSDMAAEFLIAKERERAQQFRQTLDYSPTARQFGTQIRRLDDAYIKMVYGKSWEQIQLEEVWKL